MAAKQNITREQSGVGQLYIIDYPSGGFTGASYTDIRDAIVSNFLAADTGKLKTGLVPYAVLDASGLETKTTEELLKFDPLIGPERVIGTISYGIEAEFTFIDNDIDHFKDAFSSTPSQSKVVEASAGKIGYTVAAFGGTTKKKAFTLAYLTSSDVTGTFEALIIPRVKFSVDTDLKFSKKNPQTMKLKVTGEPVLNFINPDTNLPEQFIKFQVNSAAV